MKIPVNRILKNKKLFFSVGAAVFITVLALGGTFAFLTCRTPGVANPFDPGIVNVVVEEHFEPKDIREGEIVKQVRVKNSRTNSKGEGNLNIVPVYVRVQLAATWMKENPKEEKSVVVAFDPAPYIDYQLNLRSSSTGELTQENDVEGDWVPGDDGYYYFTAPVEPDQCTDYLLEGVKLKENAVLPKLAEEGNLQVDVLVDAVQAHGTAAVNQAWDHPTSEGLQIY